MTITKFTSMLLLGSALALTACGNSGETATKTETTTTKTDAKSTMSAKKPRASKAIDYTDAGKTDDDHLWLEEVEGEAALAKVKGWNAASTPFLQGGDYAKIKDELLDVYNSPEKIPYISYRNGQAHNFWQDETNVRGVWRTTSLKDYSSKANNWTTVLDIDALAKSEDKNWVYKGNSCLAPDYERCMVSLSNGGKDAVERREFNTVTKTFVDGGFKTGESKGTHGCRRGLRRRHDDRLWLSYGVQTLDTRHAIIIRQRADARRSD